MNLFKVDQNRKFSQVSLFQTLQWIKKCISVLISQRESQELVIDNPFLTPYQNIFQKFEFFQ